MDNIAPIYTLKNAYLTFGVHPLFTGVDIYIQRGDKICLIGRNGSGKSTLLKVIAGYLEPDNGEKFIQPGLQIAYMPQESDLTGYKTLREYILSGLKKTDKDASYKADILIEQLDIQKDLNPDQASGGERKKASLARVLIQEPDILLLDEPTNHLDITTIEKLEQIIRQTASAVIVISHDRSFLKRVSTKTFWLDRGILRINNAGYDQFEDWQEQVINQEIIEQKQLMKRIEEETEWLHKGVTARRKRNMGRLRRLMALRQERRNQIKQQGSVKLQIDKGSLLSKMIIEAKHVSKSYGERKLVDNFSTRIMRGNKIGIVGPNGAGKSTLIKLLTKRIEPDQGTVRLAKNIQEAYFDQNRMTLDQTKTLWKTLAPEGDHIFVRGHFRHVVSYLKDFLFTSAQANTPVSALSGGEKNRLMLAVALANPSDFLVLDEPTNDLDMDTLDLLQEVLDEYDGTVLIVSHDRDFLDKVATSLFYMPGDGTITEFIGSYSELLEQNRHKKKSSPAKSSGQGKKEDFAQNRPSLSRIPSQNKKKLSFTEEHRLKTLPAQIASLEDKIRRLEEQISDPLLYQKDRLLFEKTGMDLTALKNNLDQLETEWLDLQLRSEENT